MVEKEAGVGSKKLDPDSNLDILEKYQVRELVDQLNFYAEEELLEPR